MFTKTCYPAVSELCKYTHRKHHTIPLEKWSRESGLWLLTTIPVGTQLRRKCTVRWLPTIRGKQTISENSNTWSNLWLEWRENESVCFSGRLEAATIELSQGKILLLPSGLSFQVHKNMFSCISKLCKDTPRTYCSIPLEKRSGESVLWVLPSVIFVILIRGNYTDDFPGRNHKQPAWFRKLKYFTKVVA